MDNQNIISHQINQLDSFSVIINQITQKIVTKGDLPYVTVEKQLEILEELTLFPFGRFLLENKGMNGYWTHYMITHPKKGRLTGLNSEGNPLTNLEKALLNSVPILLATQERFVHFQTYLQKEIKNNQRIASIPCGLMSDLLTLNFEQLTNIKLVGIDLDQASLTESKKLAKQLNLSNNVEFLHQDAWQLAINESFHIITSNGLNIYEPNEEKVVELYEQFYQALLPKGVLVTSFVTTPPSNMKEETSIWDFSKINSDNLLLQKIIFSDIIKARWQCFRTVEQTESLLLAAKFSKIKFIYDNARMFPTVIATK